MIHSRSPEHPNTHTYMYSRRWESVKVATLGALYPCLFHRESWNGVPFLGGPQVCSAERKADRRALAGSWCGKVSRWRTSFHRMRAAPFNTVPLFLCRCRLFELSCDCVRFEASKLTLVLVNQTIIPTNLFGVWFCGIHSAHTEDAMVRRWMDGWMVEVLGRLVGKQIMLRSWVTVVSCWMATGKVWWCETNLFCTFFSPRWWNVSWNVCSRKAGEFYFEQDEQRSIHFGCNVEDGEQFS